MATDVLELSALNALRLMFDTAALVLIWLVQLVIYPSFQHYHREGFRTWHRVYTRRVTYVVMPIMLGQLAVYGWLLLSARSPDVLFNACLILVAWAITFFLAVPLHTALDAEEDHFQLSVQLTAVNWWRTIVWTVCWLVTVMACY